jgi:hypothetical protein
MVAWNISQFPVQPSRQREQIPDCGATLLERLAVRVASFELGCDKFPIFFTPYIILEYMLLFDYAN